MSRQMKYSGVEWIGNIPAEWEINKLCYVSEKIFLGKTPEYSTNNNDCFTFGQKNNQLYGITFDGVKFSSEKHFYSREEYEYLLFGDILLNSLGTGSVGRVGYFDVEGKKVITDGHIIVIRTNKSIINKYLYYYLTTLRKKLEDDSVGSTNQAFLTIRQIYKIALPFPIISEQQVIVDYLNRKCAEIDAVIEKTKATIEEYKKLKQSIITEAVTKGIRGNRPMKDSGIEWIGDIPAEWEVEKLKYSIKWKSVKGNPDGTVLSLYRDYGVIPKDSRDDNHNVTSLDTSTYKVVNIGDLVINKMKAWQGSMAVSKYNGIVSPSYHVCEIINPNIHKKYLHHLLRNQLYLPEYARLSTGMRIGQWDLGYDDFKNLPIVIPRYDEQKAIVRYIENKCAEIDKLITDKTNLLSELESYKKSVIYEYVTGKKQVVQIEEQTTDNVIYPLFPAEYNTNKPRFAQAVLISKILDGRCKKYHRVKLEKTIYTIETYFGFDFDTEYAREIAGPLDSSIYDCEAIISKYNKWYNIDQSKASVKYSEAKNKNKYKKHYDKYFSQYDFEINRIISIFEDYDTDKAEIIATLFAAWNDAIIDRKSFTDEDIVNDILTNWHESKRRFSKDVWLRALDEMRENDLIPKGYGKRTVAKQSN